MSTNWIPSKTLSSLKYSSLLWSAIIFHHMVEQQFLQESYRSMVNVIQIQVN